MFLSFDGTILLCQKAKHLWLTMFTENGWVHFSEAEMIDFAVYHSVHFMKWNPKLNSDEVNVLIN